VLNDVTVLATHVQISSTRCVRNRLVASLSTSYFIKLLQGCQSQLVNQIVELQDDNKLLEQLVTSPLSSTTL
jgi:hypothetical protein